MDYTTIAQDLLISLKKHDKAVQSLKALDARIECLQNRTTSTATHTATLHRRLLTLTGISAVFKRYVTAKWAHVQQLAGNVVNSEEEDDDSDDDDDDDVYDYDSDDDEDIEDYDVVGEIPVAEIPAISTEPRNDNHDFIVSPSAVVDNVIEPVQDDIDDVDFVSDTLASRLCLYTSRSD